MTVKFEDLTKGQIINGLMALVTRNVILPTALFWFPLFMFGFPLLFGATAVAQLTFFHYIYFAFQACSFWHLSKCFRPDILKCRIGSMDYFAYATLFSFIFGWFWY